MKIDFIGHPQLLQWNELCDLWKEAFGDEDAFLETFKKTAFSCERCFCITIDGTIAAALYWFDCIFDKHPIAYLYAIATTKAHQKKGLCHTLLTYTHEQLKSKGYAGTILVPANDSLRIFYEKMGYVTCTHVSHILHTLPESNSVTTSPFALRQLEANEYALLRRQFLPAGSVLQENENLDFLQTQVQFYANEEILLAATKYEDTLFAAELLGNTQKLSDILQYFDCQKGRFQTIGNDIPYGMYYPLTDSSELPIYLGFAFD